MRCSNLLRKIGLIYLLSICIQYSSFTQHTIYPDLFIIGSDGLVEGSFFQDTAFIFESKKGGLSGGIRNFSNAHWHRDSIGLGSVALGYRALASGEGAVALGLWPEATGELGSTAMGYLTRARGEQGSTAFGYVTQANGRNGATALGSYTEAHGEDGATALGNGTEAYGDDGAIAMGDGSEAHGDDGSIAMGEDAYSMGHKGAIAMGKRTIANANSGTVMGQWNDTIVTIGYDAIDKPMLIIGNGNGGFDRSNAMVVRQNGLATIQKDLVVGAHELPGSAAITDSLFFYDKSKAAAVGGFVNTAFGANWAPNNIGLGSFSFGINTQATGEGSIALGVRNAAYGKDGATALGYFSEANANAGTVVGQYNDPLVIKGYSSADKPLFIVGNGTQSVRSNALVVRQTGEVEFSNYKLPINDGSNGQVLKTNGSGQLMWSEANDSFKCPSGYEGLNSFCIEVKANSAGVKNLQEAIETCYASGGKLPSYQQFHLAVSQRVFSENLSNVNWISDLVNDGGIKGTTVRANNTSENHIIIRSFSDTHDFRCVIEK